MTGTREFLLRLDAGEKAWLEAEAARSDRGQAQTIRRALRQYRELVEGAGELVGWVATLERLAPGTQVDAGDVARDLRRIIARATR